MVTVSSASQEGAGMGLVSTHVVPPSLCDFELAGISRFNWSSAGRESSQFSQRLGDAGLDALGLGGTKASVGSLVLGTTEAGTNGTLELGDRSPDGGSSLTTFLGHGGCGGGDVKIQIRVERGTAICMRRWNESSLAVWMLGGRMRQWMQWSRYEWQKAIRREVKEGSSGVRDS